MRVMQLLFFQKKKKNCSKISVRNITQLAIFNCSISMRKPSCPWGLSIMYKYPLSRGEKGGEWTSISFCWHLHKKKKKRRLKYRNLWNSGSHFLLQFYGVQSIGIDSNDQYWLMHLREWRNFCLKVVNSFFFFPLAKSYLLKNLYIVLIFIANVMRI